MRVGIFTDVYFPYVSGVVTAVDSLRQGLELNGCEVFIISINALNKDYKREGNLISIPGIPTPKGMYDYYFRVTYPYKAIKMVKDLNLDIIHTHTEARIGMFGKSMGKKLGIPVVHTMHTMYEQCVDYITKGHLKRIGQKGAKFIVTSFLTKSVNEVITPGRKPYILLKDKYNVNQNINVIPNGINTDYLHKENYKSNDLEKLKKELGINKNDFVILWVGRLGFEKNIQALIRMMKGLTHFNKNIKMIIVGGGPEEEKLKLLTKELDLSDNIIFTGRVENKYVGKYYNISSIFASFSTFETQGLTLIEAMAASLPVICINDPSFLDIVTDKYDGFIVKSEEEYIERIKEILNNKYDFNKIRDNARGTSEKYNLKNFGETVLNIYTNVLKNYRENNKKQNA